MNSKTVIVTIKGVKHYFNDDALNSAVQLALSFLIKLADKEVEF